MHKRLQRPFCAGAFERLSEDELIRITPAFTEQEHKNDLSVLIRLLVLDWQVNKRSKDVVRIGCALSMRSA